MKRKKASQVLFRMNETSKKKRKKVLLMLNGKIRIE